MAVSLNAVMTTGNQTSCQATSASASFSTTGITIGAVTNGLLVVTVGWQNAVAAVTGRSVTWNSVAMTEAAFITGHAGSDFDSMGIYTLINPAAGAQTLAGSWTTSSDSYASAIAFNGADQTTGINISDTVTNNLATISVAGTLDGATVASIIRDGTIVSSLPFGTQLWNFDGLAPGGTGAYSIGTSGTNAYNFSNATDSGARGTAAVHIIAAGGATPTPRQLMTLGMGT